MRKIKLDRSFAFMLASMPFFVISLLADLVFFPHFDWSTLCAWISLWFLSLSYRAYLKKVQREREPILQIRERKDRGRAV